MKKSIILCLSILLIALTGCEKNKNTWGKLEQGGITIQVGETYQLTFTSDGNVKPIWTSSNTDVATVDEKGLVTGVRVGTATVAVNGLGCKVTVMDGYTTVYEPLQDWAGTYDDVQKYMAKADYFGLETVEMDTVYNIISEEETDTIIYEKKVTYDFSAIIEDHFADVYEYNFELDEEYQVVFVSAKMTVAAAHVAEIPTYLNNRYVLKGDYYRAANNWGYYSYIYNESPVITYRPEAVK